MSGFVARFRETGGNAPPDAYHCVRSACTDNPGRQG